MANGSKDTTRQAVLTDASEIIARDRNADYGDPEDNFRTIADLWNAYYERRAYSLDGTTSWFEPVDVAMMCGLIKVARIANSPGHRDSFVDLAGYAACGWEVADNAKEDAA